MNAEDSDLREDDYACDCVYYAFTLRNINLKFISKSIHIKIWHTMKIADHVDIEKEEGVYHNRINDHKRLLLLWAETGADPED